MGRSLELLPAVDVTGGRAVQLVKGAAGSGREFGDPLEAALRWQRAGADWIHLVDLDAAFGRGENRALLADIVDRLDLQVELSGGIHDDDSLGAALATGCRRVVVAGSAIERPGWCARAIAEHQDRIAVALDVRGEMLAPRGWPRDIGPIEEIVATLDAEGCPRYIVTDVQRDGTLTGPNLDLLRWVASLTDRPLVASGGISDLGDLEAIQSLVGIGVEGAIVGTALHEGRFDLADALTLTRPPNRASDPAPGSSGSPSG